MRWTVAPHAAGVGPLIAIERRLVVAGGHHGDNGLAIAEGKGAHLHSGQVLFDNHFIAGRAEYSGLHDVFQRLLGLRHGVSHNHALACCQTVRLDHYGRCLLLEILRGFGVVREAGAPGAGDAVFLHQILGEYLARFYLGGGTGGTEDGDTQLLEAVYDAVCQRRLRSDHHQPDAFFLDGFDQRIDVLSPGAQVTGDLRCAGIARRDINLLGFGALSQLPDDGVFPGAAPDNEYFQCLLLILCIKIGDLTSCIPPVEQIIETVQYHS